MNGIGNKRVWGSRVNTVLMKPRRSVVDGGSKIRDIGCRKGIRVWWGWIWRTLVPEVVKVDDFVSQCRFIVGIHQTQIGKIWLLWREKALMQTWFDGRTTFLRDIVA